ncbi:serine/threonine-protein kinase ATM isoform X4 [Rhododendron vialii]|uniref:serine/threonine-protein kinase ATM isoform X4 n=1 Tax=Rhododendron vialii TaxID=182163 RepID=UPI00265E2D1B|nr:serine/threonine-protein kinase ATM isoform X4 [Rhododendron vialii]
MATVTSRDLQEIVSKLSSDKAKTREEGIKLLNTWLEGERSTGFVRYIGQKTAMLKPSEIRHSESWPFLITLLTKCVTLEISSSKRRLPKLIFAKTLRIVVQRVEDSGLSGRNLHLVSVAKLLFNHIWDVLKDVPSFQHEYGIILRHLLVVRDYRVHMRVRVYCSLVIFHIEKVWTNLSVKNSTQSNPKEDVFRCILTLHSLLENPPGDFPSNLREDIVKGIVTIFSFVRDEGKLSRKLIECVNTYLLKDGPNLGCQSFEIHDAVKQFAFRCWTTTHDRGLKDALVLYARLQLNLTRGAADGSELVEHLLDVVGKELDQNSICSTNLAWSDTTKDDKCGNLTSSQCGMVELAALVFYRVCLHTTKAPSAEKRARKEHAAAYIREGLMNGRWLCTWSDLIKGEVCDRIAAFCCLSCNYGTRISKDLFAYWFDGICASFERIMNDATVSHTYDCLLWALRSLHQLSSVLLLSVPRMEASSNESDRGWHTIWHCLMSGLPVFSNVASVADAALIVLGDIISNASLVLHFMLFFKKRLSSSLPISSLSKGTCMHLVWSVLAGLNHGGDLRDSLHLRQNLLRAVLALLNWQDCPMLNEGLVRFLPAAVYALCAGCAPLPLDCKELFPYHSSMDVLVEECIKGEDHENGSLHELFECSVEVLAKIDHGSVPEVCQSHCYRNVRLPHQLRVLLLQEMETYILEALLDKELEQKLLCDLFYKCALLSSFMFGSYITRVTEEVSPFFAKMGQHLLKLLDCAISVIEKSHNDVRTGCLSTTSIFEGMTSIMASCKSFVCSPLFNKWTDQNVIDVTVYTALSQSIERLLKALVKLYEECSPSATSFQSEIELPDFPASISCVPTSPSNSSISMIMDMELDLSQDSKDLDAIAVSRKTVSGVSVSSGLWKFHILSLISSFFEVLPVVVWEILFDLMEKENEANVLENILLNLCRHPYWSSSKQFSHLVLSMNNFVDLRTNLKLQCSNILVAIYDLLGTLISLDTRGKDSSTVGKEKNVVTSLRERISEKSLILLGDLLNRVAENDLFDWSGRSKLIDCISNFIVVRPHIGQTMIEKLLRMLQDPDYRVRFSLARRIGTLFQTWDGHDDLFQDICSNFGAKLVVSSKEKVVTAKEVLAAGRQPRPTMETIIITLMHLAMFSEKIELEAVFMMCVISAIDPSQRELVVAALDNLSRQLQYTSRSKYLEELMGSILFSWVACGVSLVSLVEIRDLFVSGMEPSYFMQYCCLWLLPALVLHGETSNLDWVAKVAHQQATHLVKNYFVPIFSVCMALHCSKKSGWENEAMVLQSSILRIADISENERDKLVKKHMVSIVSYIFSLASSESDPMLPFFSKEAIVHTIQTVVDGFLNMEERCRSSGVIDMIKIFRPDRVFMFIIEMHYKVTAAVHHRHKCHRLAGIEVLISILGHRAAHSSTFNYLFNLAGLFICCNGLQDQCCRIISSLLQTYRSSPSKETAGALGEQLQYLVSKLVGCCIPLVSNSDLSGTQSSQVLSLLNLLTVDSDPSLHDYIKELEPFPELDEFDGIRKFQQQLCQDYSPKEHLIKFVKRSCYLPPTLLLCSMKALHKKLVMGVIRQREGKTEIICAENDWCCDNQSVQAVWRLVRMCGLGEGNSLLAWVSDLISKVGIGDPHSVVFHLPGESGQTHFCPRLYPENSTEANFHLDTGISEELLVSLMRLLKKYLMDDSVKIIDMTSQTIQGILSTEKGQRALLSFDSLQRSLIEVHSKGVNMELVQNLLLDQERKFSAEAISLEKSTLWKTHEKNFETWICPLVYALIGYSDDIILRLCQDIVMLKSEVAELLLPNVVVNLAGRKNLDIDLCRIISLQLEENILAESNVLIKSIQVILDTLNELRLCYVMERTSSSFGRDNLMYTKPSSCGPKSRSTSVKTKDSTSTSTAFVISTSSWDKVYWLSVDYLLVAKSAISCGAYFTAVLYVEHWCEEHFNRLTLGSPDFSHADVLPHHIAILVSAVTQINERDSLYGIIQSHKLASQIVTFEHEGNWSKALEYYDLQVRSEAEIQMEGSSRQKFHERSQPTMSLSFSNTEDEMRQRKPYKGLIRSLQQMGCTHMLDLYCQGLTSRKGLFEQDLEFSELQYEAAWRAGNWDFSLLSVGDSSSRLSQDPTKGHFHEHLYSCLRALQEGDFREFHSTLRDSKQELVLSINHASKESTEYIYSTIIKLQIFYHLDMAWNLRWASSFGESMKSSTEMRKLLSEPDVPTLDQLSWLNTDWSCILKRAQLHMNLLEPFIAFRRVLLQILKCTDCTVQHLLDSASTLRKGSRFSQAAAALHEFKFLCAGAGEQNSALYWLGRLEEAKLLRAQGQHEMAINLAKYISQNHQSSEVISDVYRLVGKWLAESRSSNSRTILEKYLKRAVMFAEDRNHTDKKSITRQSQTHFHLAHYADALYRSYEERLNSNEWQAAMRLRKHKTKELEALIRRLKSSSKGEKTDYSVKIQELHKQLAMDKEEDERFQGDRDNFLSVALEGYKRCLVIGDKYDVRVVFRIVSLWFSLSSRQIVVNGMLNTIEEVQSYKFIPLVYQIASRMGSRDGHGPHSFQLLALANGDRIKDKQRSRNSFVVDMDKKLAAENLLQELSSYHGAIIRQMKQMVEIYIKLAELETKREDTNRKVNLPREIRSVRQLELVPVVTSSFAVDRSCQYPEGSFPHFKGLAESVTVMNGINAPKVVECLGSDGNRYRQLAKSGNDDLRQDAVMEQFFGLVNTFLHNHRDTWKRRLGIRTYKVVPFTPSAGVLEWVNGTLPLGEYLIGSTRNGGAHGRYGKGDWTFPKCREHMTKEHSKGRAFQEVCQNFRPVMHYFFLERFLHPADWFEKRLAYTRSVAASSMVGYIVGLGDRHSMNILIDQATAEVVHIDLGVAFEQGLMLKTPERVPFRLTRDIIDGMGVSGVEGVFRRCCEETLSVMRTNKEALLTIVEVFIHDPLYKWALSPLKALQRQKETEDDLETSLEDSQEEYEGNKDAARALMRVKQKLDGYEEGEMRSVHGQVQQLIQDAADPDRLCQMFPGWGAWL